MYEDQTARDPMPAELRAGRHQALKGAVDGQQTALGAIESHASRNLHMIEVLHERLEALNIRIFGDEPTGPGDNGKMVSPTRDRAALSALGYTLERTQSALEAIEQQVERLRQLA